MYCMFVNDMALKDITTVCQGHADSPQMSCLVKLSLNVDHLGDAYF